MCFLLHNITLELIVYGLVKCNSHRLPSIPP